MTAVRNLVLSSLAVAACAGGAARPAAPAAPQAHPAANNPAPASQAPPDATAAPGPAQPLLPPPLALATGLMPLRSTGVDQFRAIRPTDDGRGVLIAILDSGLDPGVPGLITTTTGAPKVLDLRDFSGEGAVPLTPVTPAAGGTLLFGGRKLSGLGRISRLAVGGGWYAGLLRELPLGPLPAADLNGDGNNTDAFPVIVVKASDGWVVFIDSNLNGSFDDEMPLHVYGSGREAIALGSKPVTLVANLSDSSGVPRLDFVFDTEGHGTHVAGIAAGHNLFNVAHFDGVAPGAQLIGLKIANDARGGISVSGSMLRAMQYAARFAADHGLPLVMNLSFGVGNEQETRAAIDSLVNAFLVAHPDIVFTIAAGNDGPGLSTMGFPGSADLALTVGASFPGPFARAQMSGAPPGPDVMGDWSSRGGELAKPDLVAPGAAFSSVPGFKTGEEVMVGTSMAAPHVAGLAACLESALVDDKRPIFAADIEQALRVSGAPLAGATPLDQGGGEPRLVAAYRWLVALHQGSSYVVRAAEGGSAAFRRDGLAGPGDTSEVFHVLHVGGLRAATFSLSADVPWLHVPDTVIATPGATEIRVGYDPQALATPGVYVGTVVARNPSDSEAGPLFRLINTVVVPVDLSARALDDERRLIGPSRTRRYFLRVPPSSSFTVRVSLPDSMHQHASVKLFEPSGQPYRDAPDGWGLGGEAGGTVGAAVRAEDVVPGDYELDVTAPPYETVTATAQASLGPVAIGVTTGGVELSNPGALAAQVVVKQELLGVERSVDVAGRGAPAESVTVRAPAWATRISVDVDMPREQWNEFTDFGVTLFDSTGQQIKTGPLNYAFGRLTTDLPPALAGRPITVELFPAFARPDTAPPWRATVRVRFALARPRVLGTAPLSVVAGGRVAVPAPKLGDFVPPPGFLPLLGARVAAVPALDAESIRWYAAGTP